MTKKEFNNRVREVKSNLLKGEAEHLFDKIDAQRMFRQYGIHSLTFDELLTEIAQAEVLDVSFVDDIDIDEAIKEL
jgi:Ca2+-binding EF-hand superfamily protein